MSNKVSFFIGGVQKGGTTSLHAYLDTHPALCMSNPKELHFFDDESQDWNNPDYSALISHFRDSSSVKGESTPIYLFWPKAIERLKIYNPDAKLLFLLRDPVERAYSHWRMERTRAVEPLTFSAAIREGRKRLTGVPDVTMRVFSYVERGFYAQQLQRARIFFREQQMLILRSEDLAANRASALNSICDFLEIDRFRHLPNEIRHRPDNPPPEAPVSAIDRDYLLNIYREDLIALESMIGLRWNSD